MLKHKRIPSCNWQSNLVSLNFTILGHERVIGGAEVDEPAPAFELPEQHGGGVERGGQLGGPPPRDGAPLPRVRHPHVAVPARRLLAAHEGLEIRAVVLPGHPDEVAVPGVVERPQQPPDPRAVPEAGARDEVRQLRRRPPLLLLRPPRRRGARRAERRVEDGEREEREREEQRAHPPEPVRRRQLPHGSVRVGRAGPGPGGPRASAPAAFARRREAYGGARGPGGCLARWLAGGEWRQTDGRRAREVKAAAQQRFVQGNRAGGAGAPAVLAQRVPCP